MGREIVSPRRGMAGRRDWTKGSVGHNLLSLTWPILVSHSLNMIGPFIDMIWIGRLGAASVAGAGIAVSAVTIANAATTGLVWGVRALVARFVGAGDSEGASHATRQAFAMCAGYSVVVASAGMLLAEPILRAFGVEADVVAEGSAYMRIQFAGMVTMSLRMLTESTMQALGDALTPMRIGLIFRAVHVGLCPCLVFGLGPFPSLGVSGAAATNVISQGLGAILGLWVLLSGRTGLRLTLSNFRLDLDMIGRMLKIGLPNLFMGMQHFLCVLILIWFIAPFGTLAVAAHTLWQRLDQVLVTLAMGVGTSAGVLGAQNMGANQPERAQRSGWLAAGLALSIMLVGSIAMLFWGERMAGIFSNDPDLLKMTGAFLRISAAGYWGLGINLALMLFLVGVGDTLMALLIEMVRAWVVQIPLAFLLPRLTTLGVYGVQWSMVTGFVAAALVFAMYFWLGKWKQKQV